MRKGLILILSVTLLLLTTAGCSSSTSTDSSISPDPSISPDSSTSTGSLQFYANGEDFIREGFVSKDGWRISFDNVYLSLSEIKAYQTDPPFSVDSGLEIDPKVTAELDNTYTIDLAEGNDAATPIFVAELTEVPIGHYNAISWYVAKANDGVAKGYSLIMIGQAEKNEELINFELKFDNEIKYTAGEYIGDERKGFVEEDKVADLEMTFHFDHIFGDNSLPADDDINLEAVGFEPFAILATNNSLVIDRAELEERLSAEDYSKLVEMIFTLGHVGEGHGHYEELK